MPSVHFFECASSFGNPGEASHPLTPLIQPRRREAAKCSRKCVCPQRRERFFYNRDVAKRRSAC
eukprot:867030-Pyramimonas_sp.AAC.1